MSEIRVVVAKARRRPGPHYNVEATLSNATSWTIVSTMSNVASTLLPFLATMSNEISYFRQCRNKLNMFNLFRHCRQDEISFDIVAETGNIVAKNGNNVEATFGIVKRTKFNNRIVRHCCRLWQQSRTLLRQCCLLLRHCCWCWRGLRLLSLQLKSGGQKSQCTEDGESLSGDESTRRCCLNEQRSNDACLPVSRHAWWQYYTATMWTALSLAHE